MRAQKWNKFIRIMVGCFILFKWHASLLYIAYKQQRVPPWRRVEAVYTGCPFWLPHAIRRWSDGSV